MQEKLTVWYSRQPQDHQLPTLLTNDEKDGDGGAVMLPIIIAVSFWFQQY